jgi:hypothetical protein
MHDRSRHPDQVYHYSDEMWRQNIVSFILCGGVFVSGGPDWQSVILYWCFIFMKSASVIDPQLLSSTGLLLDWHHTCMSACHHHIFVVCWFLVYLYLSSVATVPSVSCCDTVLCTWLFNFCLLDDIDAYV